MRLTRREGVQTSSVNTFIPRLHALAGLARNYVIDPQGTQSASGRGRACRRRAAQGHAGEGAIPRRAHGCCSRQVKLSTIASLYILQ